MNSRQYANNEGKTGLTLYLHLLTLSANQCRWERSSVSFRLLIRRALVIFVFGCIKLCASCVTLDSWVECLIPLQRSIGSPGIVRTHDLWRTMVR
jgi:hypothetical protein